MAFTDRNASNPTRALLLVAGVNQALFLQPLFSKPLLRSVCFDGKKQYFYAFSSAKKYSKNREIFLECKTAVFYVNMC